MRIYFGKGSPAGKDDPGASRPLRLQDFSRAGALLELQRARAPQLRASQLNQHEEHLLELIVNDPFYDRDQTDLTKLRETGMTLYKVSTQCADVAKRKSTPEPTGPMFLTILRQQREDLITLRRKLELGDRFLSHTNSRRLDRAIEMHTMVLRAAQAALEPPKGLMRTLGTDIAAAIKSWLSKDPR